MYVISQLHDPDCWRVPQRKAPRCLGRPRAGVHTVQNRKISRPCQVRNKHSSLVSLVVSTPTELSQLILKTFTATLYPHFTCGLVLLQANPYLRIASNLPLPLSLNNVGFFFLNPTYALYTLLHVGALNGPPSGSTETLCEQHQRNACPDSIFQSSVLYATRQC